MVNGMDFFAVIGELKNHIADLERKVHSLQSDGIVIGLQLYDLIFGFISLR